MSERYDAILARLLANVEQVIEVGFDEWVIDDLSDFDLYKALMQQHILHCQPGVKVDWEFKNRKIASYKISDWVNLVELRRQLDHIRTLRFTPKKIAHLRGMRNSEDQRIFKDDYLEFLETYGLPAYHLMMRDDEIHFEVHGDDAPWEISTLWETIALSVISEMRNRAIMLTLSVDEQREVYIGGATKLAGKIDFLLDNPRVKFIDFGTRRRFSGPWQRFILESLIAELPPEQFLGTSNVKLGIELGIDISGTNAHEEPMVIAAIMDDDIKAAQHYFLRTWYEEYGPDFAIFLPDTFTTEYALSILTREEAELYRGMRQDSGCPKADGDKKIAFYESMEIDPMTKIHLMSDGLTHERMAEYADYFEGRILVGFGWGTNLTCDMGLPELFVSMSIVIKAVMANGIATVKLSDNIAKAICIVLARIELYKRLVGYHVTFDKKCEV